MNPNPIDRTRTSALFNTNNVSVALIGLGGIGSITGLMLGKMGLAWMQAFDDDVVDDVNIATQFYRLSDVGKSKAEAWKQMMGEFADTQIVASPYRVVEDTQVYGNIIVSGVDSIEARKKIWEMWQRSKAEWYLDARMGAMELYIYAVNRNNPDSIALYEKRISSTNEGDIPDLPCTAKATIFTGAMAAGHICNTIRKIASYKPVDMITFHSIEHGILLDLGGKIINY